VFLKGDEHILSVMESKEQQKKSLVKNEKDIKQEKQYKELQQRETDLNSKIIDLKQIMMKFEPLFEDKNDWNDPKNNKILEKLITDSDAIKNLRKEIMTGQNQKVELQRRIDRMKSRIEKKKAERENVLKKIQNRKNLFKKTRPVEIVKSRFIFFYNLKKNMLKRRN
jgi:predicted  nucleic acid-binding Zn-ribbon protein